MLSEVMWTLFREATVPQGRSPSAAQIGMKNTLKNVVKKLVLKTGYSVSRARAGMGNQHWQQPSFSAAIERLALRRPSFQSVIDVGAAVGAWSSEVAARFPDRRHLLIEANPVHLSALQSVCRTNRHWAYVLKACGPECGRIFFDGRDPFGGQARAQLDTEAQTELPMTTIDREVESHNLTAPFLIKLDTHGFEIPIMRGAENALAHTEVLVVEAYNFLIGTEAIRFWTLCQWLETRGFLPIDMFDLLYRPHDLVLWQMDIVFMRSSRSEFETARYR